MSPAMSSKTCWPNLSVQPASRRGAFPSPENRDPEIETRNMATAAENTGVTIRPAEFPGEIEVVRALFLEYAESLGFDLCFQNFSEELDGLPGAYAAPKGGLLLAFVREKPAGCFAFRKHADGVCEMKRLYVRPAFRGLAIGRLLACDVIRASREAGYQAMRLDTIGTMKAALSLYRSLGFQKIAPYYSNPIAGAEYMELALQSAD